MLQTVSASELRITESLRLHLQLVLDNTNVSAFTSCKEIGDIANSGIEGKVSKMDGIRWLVGQWKLLTNGVSWGLSVLKNSAKAGANCM